MVKKPLVYVAGPISVGDYIVNVKNAVKAGIHIEKIGGVYFVPHMEAFYHLLNDRSYEDSLAYDFQMILRCDALLRLPGVSKGSDREVVFAREHGIPVFTSFDELAMWIINYGKKEFDYSSRGNK